MKKIGLVARKFSAFKYLIPLIEQARLRQDMELFVVFLADGITTESPEHYDLARDPLRGSYAPEGTPGTTSIHSLLNLDALLEFCADKQIKNLASFEPLVKPGADDTSFLKQLRSIGTRYFYMQYSMDVAVTWPYRFSNAFFQEIEGFLMWSPYWADTMMKAFEAKALTKKGTLPNIKSQCHFVGFPGLDGIKKIDTSQVRKKYKLSAEVTFFDAIGVVTHVPNLFYRYFFTVAGTPTEKFKRTIALARGDFLQAPKFLPRLVRFSKLLTQNKTRVPNYAELCQLVRDANLKLGRRIVSKFRPKNRDPKYFSTAVDCYVGDESLFPQTLHELLKVSDRYVGFNSTAVMEAVLCGSSALLFEVLPAEFQYAPYGGKVYEYISRCFREEGSWLRFSGVTWPCLWNEDPRAKLENLGEMKLDPARQRTYVEKFLGYDDGESSLRMLDVLARF